MSVRLKSYDDKLVEASRSLGLNPDSLMPSAWMFCFCYGEKYQVISWIIKGLREKKWLNKHVSKHIKKTEKNTTNLYGNIVTNTQKQPTSTTEKIAVVVTVLYLLGLR